MHSIRLFPNFFALFLHVLSLFVVTPAVPDTELRGLWIATVYNIDWPRHGHVNVSNQQQELTEYLDIMAETNLNCLFFQVRPVGDALYNSSLEPWSVYLTGKQGEAPSPLWDPLQFVVDHAHQRGIQVHAWINPFRAKVCACYKQQYTQKP